MKLFFLVLLMGAVALGAGCRPAPPEPEGHAAAGGQAEELPPPNTTEWKIDLATDAPENPPVNKPVQFTARVTGAGGQPLEGADVLLDIKMPAHEMGVNRPQLAQVEPGVYQGKGVFTMGGAWVVDVHVTRGEQRARQSFQYTARRN
jgi:hypothetical protein